MVVLALVVGSTVGGLLGWTQPPGAVTTAVSPMTQRAPFIPQGWGSLDPTILRATIERTVMIESSTCGGQTIGTGVLLGNERLLTNRHVLEAGMSSRAVRSDGVVIPLSDIRTSQSSDAAMARPASTEDRTTELATDFETLDWMSSAAEDRAIFSVGYPGGDQLQTVAGYATKVVDGSAYGVGAGPVLLSDIPAEPGQSGSGVFARNGMLVGIIAASARTTRTAVILPVERLRDPLEFHTIAPDDCDEHAERPGGRVS